MQKVLFLFGELNDDDIDWLIANGKVEKIPEETVLIVEGKPSDQLFILLEGSVSVAIAVKDKYKEIAVLSSGEVFGEMSFVDARPPSASVETLAPSIILSVPREKLARQLLQDVGFASRFYRAMSLFLSQRLRSAVKFLGLDKEYVMEKDAPNDLSPEMQDTLVLAKTRFDWLLRRVKTTV